MMIQRGICCLRKQSWQTSVMRILSYGPLFYRASAWGMCVPCRLDHDEMQLYMWPCPRDGSRYSFRTFWGWSTMSSEESERKLAFLHTPGASGNWYNPCRKQSGITYRGPSKCSYPLAHSFLGVYPKIIIKKKISYSWRRHGSIVF